MKHLSSNVDRLMWIVFILFVILHHVRGIVYDDHQQQIEKDQLIRKQPISVTTSSKRHTVHQKKINPQHFVRNELLEAVYIADVHRVNDLLQVDQDILSSRPPVLPDRIEENEGRSALLVCGLDPQTTNKTKVDIDCSVIAKLLHGAGANMSLVDYHGWDALAMGAIRGHSRYCKYLLKHAKVNPNHVDHQHVTALMKAAGHAHFGVLHNLLKYGAKWDIRDNKGLTALHYATRLALRNESYVPFLKRVAKLATNGFIDVIDSRNRTCLMYAAIDNNRHVVELFLNLGSDPRLQDDFYVSIPSMTSDDQIRGILLEEIAKRIEQEHSTWLKNQVDFDLNVNFDGN